MHASKLLADQNGHVLRALVKHDSHLTSDKASVPVTVGGQEERFAVVQSKVTPQIESNQTPIVHQSRSKRSVASA